MKVLLVIQKDCTILDYQIIDNDDEMWLKEKLSILDEIKHRYIILESDQRISYQLHNQ